MAQARARTGRGGTAAASRAGSAATAHAEQLAQLPALVERGAEAYGFRGQVWTCQRVAEVIRRTFGVTYHPAHVSRLLHAVRHSVQRPRTRATQRNERRSRRGGRSAGPRSKKSAPRRPHHRLGRSIRLLPAAHGGAHLGAVRADARACACRSPTTISPPSVASRPRDASSCRPRSAPTTPRMSCASCACCCARSGQAPRHLGWRAHSSRPADQRLPAPRSRQAPAPRATPGYAPDLNPAEGIWNYLKRVELANRCCADLATLGLALRRAKERLRHKRTVLQACFTQAGYQV